MIKRWYSLRTNSEGYTTIRTLPLWYNVYRFLRNLLFPLKWRTMKPENKFYETNRIPGKEFTITAGAEIQPGSLIFTKDGKAYPVKNPALIKTDYLLRVDIFGVGNSTELKGKQEAK